MATGPRQPLLAPAHRPRAAEVRHERARVGPEQKVLRLDVAVDHAVVVSVLKCEGGLTREAQGVLYRQFASRG